MDEPRKERSGTRELPADDLRADVRYLARCWGNQLREQGGEELLAAVEVNRPRAIELREADDVALDGLLTLVRDLDAELAPSVVWASPPATLRHQHLDKEHGCGRWWAWSLASPDEPLRESGSARPSTEFQADLAPDDLQAFLANLCVTPTFTAHLTESRRRAILDLLARLGELVRA